MRERSLEAPWEVSYSWSRRLRCRWRHWKARGCEFGWLGVIYMDRTPSRSILIHHLIGVGYPGYPKGSLPPWSQLVGTLWRSR